MTGRDELPTLVICQACGGNYEIVEDLPSGRYRAVACRWCVRGGMTRDQLKAWQTRQARRKKGPDGT